MALALISCLVLGPLAILVVDILRGVGRHKPASTPAAPVQLDADGHRVRAPRPKSPAPAAKADVPRLAPAPSPGFRPTGGRRDYFGDGLLDRS